MKKILVLPLALVSLLAVGCDKVPSSETSSSSEASSSVVSSSSSVVSSTSVAVAHTIHVVNNEELGVTLEADVTSAVKDITITITVTNSKPTKTLVKGIHVNGGDLIELKSDNTASFKMLDEDVVVTVEAEELTYLIHDETEGLACLSGLPEKAFEGDLITFTVFTKPGFTFLDKVVVFQGEEETETFKEVPLTTTEAYKYQFVMPASEISVKVTTEATMYAVTRGKNSSNISYTKNTVTNSTASNLYASVGQIVEVGLKDTDTAKPTGISVNGMEITTPTEEGGSAFQFAMPSRPATVDVLTTPYYRPLKKVESEHLKLTFLSREETVDEATNAKTFTYTEITQSVAREDVYVRVTGVTEDFVVSSMEGNYKTKYSDSNSLTITKDTDDENEANLYTFRCPVSDDITVTVTEENLTTYKGQPFVGKYKFVELYRQGSKTDSLSSTAEIKSSGKIEATSGKPFTSSIISNHDAKNKRLTLLKEGSDKFFMSYEGDLGYTPFSNDKVYQQDAFFMVKDDGTTLTYKSNIFGQKASGKTYFAVEIFTKENNVETFKNGFFVDFTDEANPKLFMNVTFEFTKGSFVSDKNAEYKVKKGETLVADVANCGSSLYALRDGLQATYTGANGELVLDGLGSATYKGSTWSYVFDKETNDLTLTSGGNSLTLGLTLTDKTYVEKGAVAAENDFDGKTFSNFFTSSFDDYFYFYKVTFGKSGSVDVLITTGKTEKGTKMYPNNSNKDPDTYVINDDGTISLTMHNGSSEKVLVLTPNETKTTLTIDKDFSNVYTTKDLVLSLVL
jgi:lipoprotein